MGMMRSRFGALLALASINAELLLLAQCWVKGIG